MHINGPIKKVGWIFCYYPALIQRNDRNDNYKKVQEENRLGSFTKEAITFKNLKPN